VDLPSFIKAEVKLTTGGGISVTSRELKSLAVDDESSLGILAALFVGGDLDADGRWVIVDAGAYRDRTGDTLGAVRSTLVSTARGQPWLDGLRRHIDDLWPGFLDAFKDAADRGHARLLDELKSCHQEGTLRDRLPRHRILGAEHRATVTRLVERHGESDAGRLAQDLLAYLLALAGYGKVTINAVGVPDILLEDPASGAGTDFVTLTLASGDVARLARLCRESGDEKLAGVLEARLPSVRARGGR
jgi:hypothetical protein